MSQQKRRSAATATVGLAGVAGAGALRHSALEDAYREKTKRPIKRPRFAAERRLLTQPRGRARWLAGMGLGAVSIPPAAVGVNGLINKLERHRGFIAEGITGAKDSIRQRNETFAEKPPAKLALGNYLAGAAVGSGAGGLTHHALSRSKFPGTGRSALAGVAGVVAGSATLPLQSKLTQRASHGRYEVTPTGVRRRKVKPVRPSSKAGREVTKMSPHVHGPSVRAGYLPPRSKVGRAASTVGAKVGTKWTAGWSQVADAIEAPPARRTPKRKVAATAHKLVATGRNKLGETARAISYDVSSLNDKDQLIRQVGTGQGRIHKADDIGANLSRRERRLRFTASGGTPVIGDITSAAQAARLAPPELRRRTAAQQYAANVTSGAAGNVGGAVGAAALASRHKGFERKANQVNDAIDGAKNRVRASVGMPPTKPGAGRVTRALQSPKVPKLVRSGARLVARKPGVAAVGALAGGAITGNVGSQAAYGAIMTRDDRHRAKNPHVRHGSQKIAKGDTPKPLSQREKKQLGRRKEHNAAMSIMTGTTGLSALGATLGAKGLQTKAGRRLVGPRRAIPLARKLAKYPVPALTVGAGIGGINAYTGAAIQHKEAKQVASVRKSYVPGQGWVKATEAGKDALRGARGAHVSREQSSDMRWFRTSQRLNAKSLSGSKRKIHVNGGGPEAETFRFGGRRGTSVIRGQAPDKKTARRVLAHEQAHAAPARSSYRFHQIAQDDHKAMREEARADYLSGGHFKNQKKSRQSPYAEEAKRRSREVRREPESARWSTPTDAYIATQNKMRSAGAKPGGVRKGIPGVRAALVTTGRRAPAVRRGFTRQTRTATGIKVSTVRGGLMR